MKKRIISVITVLCMAISFFTTVYAKGEPSLSLMGESAPVCGKSVVLKFDNIKNNKDKDQTPDDAQYTHIEYAYYLMATHAGINMSECRLHREKGSAHFMTKRFDRKGLKGEKLHMQSLCAMAHMDFNMPRMYSYE